MVSRVQVEEIDWILLLGFQGQIQGYFWNCFLPWNTWIQRWCFGVQILGPMSGVMNQCWVFSDLPGEVNLFFCYASAVSLGIKPKTLHWVIQNPWTPDPDLTLVTHKVWRLDSQSKCNNLHHPPNTSLSSPFLKRVIPCVRYSPKLVYGSLPLG